MRSIILLIESLLLLLAFGCVDPPATDGSDEQALAAYCETDCWCPQGTECNHASHACQGIIDFGPPAPYPLAGATCQCDYGSQLSATGPHCVPGGGACTTSCDCPHGTVCSGGACTPDFGPFPECHCDSQCGDSEVCVGGICYFAGGSGGGGGGTGGGGSHER